MSTTIHIRGNDINRHRHIIEVIEARLAAITEGLDAAEREQAEFKGDPSGYRAVYLSGEIAKAISYRDKLRAVRTAFNLGLDVSLGEELFHLL